MRLLNNKSMLKKYLVKSNKIVEGETKIKLQSSTNN